MTVGTQLRMGEPARRKLVAAVGHVLAAKHSEAQHLLWRELRRESGLEIAPHRLGPVVDIAMLHTVVDDDLSFRAIVDTRLIQFAAHDSEPHACSGDDGVEPVVVGPGTAVLLGDAEPEQPGRPGGAPHLAGDGAVGLPFLVVR